MTGRSRRREYDATEMIPGGLRGRRSVPGRRKAPRDTAVLEAVREPSPAERIGAALERHTAPGAALALPAAPQPAQEPAREALSRLAQEAQAAAAREPRFTPSRGLPVPQAPPAQQPAPAGAQRPEHSTPGPVHITGELPMFAEAFQAREKQAEPGHDALPSLLWCAGCGRDFTDNATAEYDRMLLFLHIRAAETGWRRDAFGLFRCPQCQQSQWVAAWRPPVLAGGSRAELALRESVEGSLPEDRRMPPAEVTFDGLPAGAVTVSHSGDGPVVRVDWKSVIASPQRAGGSRGGRHARRPGVLPHIEEDTLARLRAGLGMLGMPASRKEARAFPLGDILTVTTGHLFSPPDLERVRDLLSWMTGEILTVSQLPDAADECAPALLAQHPELAAIGVPESFGRAGPESEPAVEAWLAAQAAVYGETREVVPLAHGSERRAS